MTNLFWLLSRIEPSAVAGSKSSKRPVQCSLFRAEESRRIEWDLTEGVSAGGYGECNALAWVRRLIVSVGIGSVSYALMLGIMVLWLFMIRELEPSHHLRL